MSNKLYLEIISEAELQRVRNDNPPGRRHPLLEVALADPKKRAHSAIEEAARAVHRKNAAWLTSLKPRLLATDDLTHASSALGELRAYGALLETWMEVQPGPKVAYSNVLPEFGVDAGDGKVIVEVHTRQLDNSEDKKLSVAAQSLMDDHAANVDRARRERRQGPVVTFQETEVFPTGQPNQSKPGDSSITNTISRIASIKAKETQIDEERPFVLWLDLHDPTVWGVSLPEEMFRPLFSEAPEGMINSGPFWFALYGRKGMPLLHSRSYDYQTLPMAHDGRFFQTMTSHGKPTLVSAVIYSLGSATILMENPNAARPLPPKFRASLLKAPDFRVDLSIIEWEAGAVAEIIAADCRMIVAAANALTIFDPTS